MPQISSQRKTILVAEDYPDTLAAVRTFLEHEGYRVVEAHDGEEAVAAAERERPDLIMMDLNMPNLDGLGAAKRIRQNPILRDVPIIANSAYGKLAIEYSISDDELGPAPALYLPKAVNESIQKPLNWDELREMLSRLLGGS